MHSIDKNTPTAEISSLVPLDTAQLRMKDGAVIFIRRTNEHKTRRIILSHGNGLAINGYEEFWQHLLPEAELILFDFRNHGVNPQTAPSSRNNWEFFVSDMDEILHFIDTRYGKKPTYGVFHSMSALTSLIYTSRYHYPWTGLVLFEPPAVPAQGPERNETLDIHIELSARTYKRRSEFPKPEHLAQSLARLLMFQRMHARALLQLAASTLRQTAQGTYELSCPPAFEANTFAINKLTAHWEDLAKINCPVLIVSSAPEDSDMPVLAKICLRLAQEFGFPHVVLRDAGHMVQLDHPQTCARLVIDLMNKTSASARARSAES